tara:strand:+ start:90 stop:479 length:390 start_codon:yes stop_codon:yes gene_type:complete
MFQLTFNYFVSAILGIMLFFSFIVAPVTFTTLNEENARKFIRKIFPYYYNVNLGIGILATLIFVFFKSFNLDFFLILLVTLLFALSNYVLMPLINKFKDSNQDKNFKISHLVSVVINFLQMILLIIILV